MSSTRGGRGVRENGCKWMAHTCRGIEFGVNFLRLKTEGVVVCLPASLLMVIEFVNRYFVLARVEQIKAILSPTRSNNQ